MNKEIKLYRRGMFWSSHRYHNQCERSDRGIHFCRGEFASFFRIPRGVKVIYLNITTDPTPNTHKAMFSPSGHRDYPIIRVWRERSNNGFWEDTNVLSETRAALRRRLNPSDKFRTFYVWVDYEVTN